MCFFLQGPELLWYNSIIQLHEEKSVVWLWWGKRLSWALALMHWRNKTTVCPVEDQSTGFGHCWEVECTFLSVQCFFLSAGKLGENPAPSPPLVQKALIVCWRMLLRLKRFSKLTVMWNASQRDEGRTVKTKIISLKYKKLAYSYMLLFFNLFMWLIILLKGRRERYKCARDFH